MFTLNTRRVPADLGSLRGKRQPRKFGAIRERSALRTRETDPVAATIPFPPLEAHEGHQREFAWCDYCHAPTVTETDVALVDSVTLLVVGHRMHSRCGVCGHEDITR